MTSSAYADILQRIESALDAARTVFARFTPGAIETEYKSDTIRSPKRIARSTLSCGKTCCATAKAGSRKKPQTIPRASIKSEFGLWILSMVRVSSL